SEPADPARQSHPAAKSPTDESFEDPALATHESHADRSSEHRSAASGSRTGAGSEAGPIKPRLERSEWLWLGAVLVAVFAATIHKVENQFVWDDIYVIEKGDVIHDPSQIGEVFFHHTVYVSSPDKEALAPGVDTYRPITLLTFFWDAAISGRSPLSYHLTNAFTHLAVVALVFFLTRRILPAARKRYAVLGAAFFGLTPLLGEAHVWINGRSDLFCALFGLSAILLWRRAIDYAHKSKRRRSLLLHGVAAALFFLGLLSKEVLIMGLVPLLWFPESSPVPFRTRLARLGGFFFAATGYLGIRGAVLSGLRTHGDPFQLLHAASRFPALTVDGLFELFVPTRVYVRSMVDDFSALGPGGLIGLGLVFLAITIAVVRHRRDRPALFFSLAWFAATLAPAAVIATMLWPGYGRYLYLPAAGAVPGVVSVVAEGLGRASPERRRLWLGIAALYLAVLGGRLHLFTYDFHDEITLYERMIEAAPDRAHGYGWLGITYLEREQPARAVPLLLQADRKSPEWPRYLYNLGLAFQALGQQQDALNVAATGIGRYSPAAGNFHRLAVDSLHPRAPELVVGHLGQCLIDQPGYPLCVEAAERVLQENPGIYGPIVASAPLGAPLRSLAGQ
ncbi:MAG: hypothetical protein AAGF12_29200, partial [Myxococcota bacterium]